MAVKKGKLTPRQERFKSEYLIEPNATKAAIKAGYSKKTAGSIGAENLTKPLIAEAIAEKREEIAKKFDITVDSVLESILSVIARCNQGEPVKDREGLPTGEWKFDPGAVLKGNELLMKHLGMDKGIGSKDNPLHVVGIEVQFIEATKENNGK